METKNKSNLETIIDETKEIIDSAQTISTTTTELLTDGQKKVEEVKEKIEEKMQTSKWWNQLPHATLFTKIILSIFNFVLKIVGGGRTVSIFTTDYLKKIKEKEHLYEVRITSLKTVLAEYERKFVDFETYIKKLDTEIMDLKIKLNMETK